MCVILSSFHVYNKSFINKYKGYSVSRWQPKWFPQLEKIDILTATKYDGSKLLLKEFDNPLLDYKREYFYKLEYYRDDFFNWINSLNNKKTIVLCCWCPYSKSSKSQLKKYNNFVCHTGLIGRLINKYRPDINVLLDKDHMKLNSEYIPFIYKTV